MSAHFKPPACKTQPEENFLTFHQMGVMDGFGGRTSLKVFHDEGDGVDGLAESIRPTILDFGEEDEENKGPSKCDKEENRRPKVDEEMVVTKEQLTSAVKKPLKVLNQLSFPVTKASLGPAGHKPLTIGGASRHKRDAGGHCVSEAFLSLKFDDSALEGIEPPRKRQHLASVGNADETVALSPVVFSVGPPAKTNIIGDHSRPHLLPTVSSRHCGLKCITADALKRMILNEFAPDDIERFWIVDCRYPYEYAAGHIRTAVNAYHREDLVKQFFQQPYVRQNPLKRIIVVFHCEFSAERGPLLARYMRNEDRKLHQYPYLAYPEIYLLEGGYKKFFECAKDLCEPPFYTPMRAVQHQSEFIHFKTKAKSFHDFTVMSSRSTRSGNMFDIQSKQ